MATETRNQSASLAEVYRSFFTDPAGSPHSKNEDIQFSNLPSECENQAHLCCHRVVMKKQIPISQLINTRTIGRRSLWKDVYIFCYLTLHMPGP
jgi:hypothetical protein